MLNYMYIHMYVRKFLCNILNALVIAIDIPFRMRFVNKINIDCSHCRTAGVSWSSRVVWWLVASPFDYFVKWSLSICTYI